jgi:hypothetical protein
MQPSGNSEREKAYVVLVRGCAEANRKLVNDPARSGIVNSLVIGTTGEEFDETQFFFSDENPDYDQQQLDSLNQETLKEQLLLKDLDMLGDADNSDDGGVANVAKYEAMMEDANLYRQDLKVCAKLLGITVLEMPMLEGFNIVLHPWQVTTAADILTRYLRGDTGVICADSIGLGKTISVGVALLVVSRDVHCH